MAKSLKVLIVEDDPSDLALIIRQLRKDFPDFVSKIAKDESSLCLALDEFCPDIVLSDYSFPQFDGKKAFEIARKAIPSIPFILVSGMIGEENAVEFIKMGITDFILKANLFQVGVKINRALSEHAQFLAKQKTESELQESLLRLQQAEIFLLEKNNKINRILASITDGFFAVGLDYNITYWNAAMATLTRLPASVAVDQPIWDVFPPDEFSLLSEMIRNCLNKKETPRFDKHFEALGIWGEVKLYPSAEGLSGYFKDVSGEKEAQKELFASQHRLTEAQKMGKLGNWKVDFITGQSTWSDQTYIVLDLKPEDVKPSIEAYVACVHPDDQLMVQNIIEQSEKNLQPTSFTHRVLTKTGSVRFLQSKSEFEFNDAGELKSIVGTIQDITELKVKELEILEKNEDLETSRQQYQQLFDLSPLPKWVMDPNSLAFLDVNEAAVHHYGYSKQEFLTMTVPDLWPSEDRQKMRRHAKAEIADTKASKLSSRHITKAGKPMDVEVRSSVIVFASKQARMAVVNDVTEQLAAEHKIRNSEKRFEALLENSADGVATLDLKRQHLDISRSGLAILGHASSMELAKVFMSSVDSPFRPLIDETLKSVAATPDKQATVEFPFATGKGNTIWLEATYHNQLDNQSIQGVVINFRDITERKQNEKAREEHIEQISRRYEDLKQFSFVVTHNLRAPLTNIMSISNMLVNGQINTKERANYFHMLQTCASQLNLTIEDLVTMLVIKRSAGTKTSKVTIKSLWDKVCSQFSLQLAGENVKIDNDFDLDLTIDFNQIFLHSILTNLLDNAIKYRKPDQRLCIKLKSQRNEGDYTLIFSDNGIGFNLAANREKVFGLYQRFHHEQDGKGMGLYIIKLQMEELGGQVQIHSQPGHGTSVILTFKNNAGTADTQLPDNQQRKK